MSSVQTIVFSLINSLVILFYSVNLLTNPLSKKMKSVYFLYIFLISVMLQESYRQFVEPICVFSALLGISKIQKNIVMTGISIFLGYIITTNMKNGIYLIFYYMKISFFKVPFEYQIILLVLFCAVIAVLTEWIGEKIQFFLFNQRNENLENFLKIVFVELAITTVLYMFRFFYRTFFNYPCEILIIAGTIVTLGVTFFIFRALLVARIINKSSNQNFEQTEYQKVQEYITFLERNYLEFKTFKHDYNNILVSLNAYIEEGASEELRTYFHSKILPTGSNRNEKNAVLLNFNKIHILDIKGLLYRKTLFALNENLNVSLEINNPMKKVDIDGVDLVRVLGIFMDNAIEGALETEERQIAILIDVKASYTVIGLYNSCKEESRNISVLYEIGYSTKGDKRGIGLYSAREIIRKYSNVTHVTSCEKNVFMQQLEIYTRSEAKHPKKTGSSAL